MSKLELIPIKQDEAKAFINKIHRHHKAPVGSIFQIAPSVLKRGFPAKVFVVEKLETNRYHSLPDMLR